MAHHRELVLDRFHHAAGDSLLGEYLLRRGFSSEQATLAAFNLDAFNQLLAEADPDCGHAIDEELHRINDVATTSVGVLARAFERLADAPVGMQTSEEQALWLFLYEPEQFEFAYSHYLLLAGGANLNLYRIPVPQLDLSAGAMTGFTQGVREHLQAAGKGPGSVRTYHDQGGDLPAGQARHHASRGVLLSGRRK